jgi:hypothetical protein
MANYAIDCTYNSPVDVGTLVVRNDPFPLKSGFGGNVQVDYPPPTLCRVLDGQNRLSNISHA